MTEPVSALYRPSRRHDWQAVEIVADHKPTGGLVLRERGRFYAGVFIAARDTVRISGPEFEVALSAPMRTNGG